MNLELAIEVLFFVIIFQSIFSILKLQGILSEIYFSFSLIFFGIIPWLEYKNNIINWGFPPIENETYIKANLSIIFANIIFSYFYSKEFFQKYRFNKNLNFTNYNRALGLSILACLFTLFLNDFNFINMMYRGGLHNSIELSQIEFLMASVLRLIPFICFIIYVRQSIKYSLRVFILFILVLISSFPTGIPRFQSAAIYLTILIIYMPFLLNRKIIAFLLILSLIFVFPLMNQFRYYSENSIDLNFNINFFFEGHFDSYQSLLHVIQYDVITFGYQLLGPLLFFIPRALWDEKPSGSGHYMASLFNLEFTNISSNIYAEGFINFGYIGIFIFSIIIGKYFGYASKLIINPDFPEYKKYILYYCSFYSFFILRGDLLSSLSYFLGFIILYFAIYFLVKKS